MSSVEGRVRRVLTPRDWLGLVREHVALIAARAGDQVRWLVEHRFPVDEIALQFSDDVLHQLPALRRAGLMTAELEGAMRALDDHFGGFSGARNAARWSEEALFSDPCGSRRGSGRG